MKKNSFFCALVPAMPCLYSKIDKNLGHYRRYKKQDIKKIVQKNKTLKIIRLSFINPIGAFGWLLKYKLFKSTIMNNKDANLIEQILPLIKILDKFKLPFGQSLFFVLQKNKLNKKKKGSYFLFNCFKD